jgi:hypothetical protein
VDLQRGLECFHVVALHAEDRERADQPCLLEGVRIMGARREQRNVPGLDDAAVVRLDTVVDDHHPPPDADQLLDGEQADPVQAADDDVVGPAC